LRRISTTLLLFVLAMPLLAPMFFSGAEQLPACCRRNGAHHCAMMGMGAGSTQAQFQSKCPYGPVASAEYTSTTNAPPPVQAFFGEVAHHPALFAQTQAGQRISAARSHQKRGPPADSLS
jgi:hypothetical protein